MTSIYDFVVRKGILRRYRGSNTEVVVPEIPMVRVGGFATSLRSVVLPNGLTSIDSRGLAECRMLRSVTLPQGVTCIDDGAFEYCKALTVITVPDSVTEISGSAFDHCPTITVHAPKGSYLEEYAKEKGFAFVATQ